MTQQAFLKVLLAQEGSPESLRLHDRLTRADRATKCIQRAMFLAGALFILSLAALSYCAFLPHDLFSDRTHFAIKSLTFVGLTSLISEVEFLGYRLWHRISVNRLQEECHRLLLPLVGSQLMEPQDIGQALPPFDNLLLFPPST